MGGADSNTERDRRKGLGRACHSENAGVRRETTKRRNRLAHDYPLSTRGPPIALELTLLADFDEDIKAEYDASSELEEDITKDQYCFR